MEKFVYRFRSIERLLGEEATDDCIAVPGELEKLHIYFAPPDQLNDPLEGYREIYWSGDKIVWLNLFRHYLLTLANRSWEVEANFTDEKAPRELTVHISPESLDEEYRRAFQSMDERLQSDHIINAYVEALSKRRRKCYKPELLSYLHWLHWYMLNIVIEVNNHYGLTSISYGKPPFNPPEWMRMNRDIVRSIGTRLSAHERTAAHANIAMSDAAFRINSSLTGDARYVDANDLITDFPPRYCESIEKLMFPDWYVACFMADASNSSIWGTYGEKHTAICLKYKVSTSSKDLSLGLYKPAGQGNKGISQAFQAMPLQRVHYNREHVTINFFTSMGNINRETGYFWYRSPGGEFSSSADWFLSDDHHFRDLHWKKFDKALTSKLDQWKAEQEFRVVLKPHTNITDNKERLLKYKFSELDGLIFGIKTPLKYKLQAISIIKKHCKDAKRKSFNFYQAYYDPETKTIGHDLLDISMYWKALEKGLKPHELVNHNHYQ